ncbi:lysosomal amino acid transporter [Pycnococcus provasolii]
MAPHGDGGCLCLSGSITWLQDFFETCIYSHEELLGFYVGLLSIALWSVAQIPQFLENQANRSSDALSVWFLLQWLLGDSANLLGCLLTGTQQPTETYTAVYFILADLMMLGQYTYYALRDRLMQLPVYDTPPTTPNTPSANDNNNHNRAAAATTQTQTTALQVAAQEGRRGRREVPRARRRHTPCLRSLPWRPYERCCKQHTQTTR